MTHSSQILLRFVDQPVVVEATTTLVLKKMMTLLLLNKSLCLL